MRYFLDTSQHFCLPLIVLSFSTVLVTLSLSDVLFNLLSVSPPEYNSHEGKEVWLFCSLLYPQCLKQCLAHGRYSVNTYWKNEWLTLTIKEKTEHSETLSHFPQAILTVRDKTSGCVFLKLKFYTLLWYSGYVNQDFFASKKLLFNTCVCSLKHYFQTTSICYIIYICVIYLSPSIGLYSSTNWKFFTHLNLGRR